MSRKGDKFSLVEHQERHDWYRRHGIIVMADQLPPGMIEELCDHAAKLQAEAWKKGLYPYVNPWGTAIKQ